ncbi:helix-turn-helix domain-containing protein [Caenispirillum bisanense]|uniref:helix-turn-helix domain-containing protein n=1 Tax=Caenispirillum bisanense TaxID=414052 RepID=UPI0031DB23A7
MSDVFEGIREGLEDALAHARGESGRGIATTIPADRVDVAAIRAAMGLSQPAFARTFAVSLSTVRKWEQGQRVPSGAARVLLRVMEREPEAVRRALEG